MEPLNFPKYTFRFKNKENKIYIFDAIRKKFVVLTPEEWVRQHTVQFLIQEKNYPISLINIEKELIYNDLKKRYDIVIFNSDGSIFLVAECKRSKVKITQQTFDQIARYNMILNAEYLMVTNGLHHYYCTMNYEAQQYHFLREIPDYTNS
ncbi:type I restriction enzyme HsdR N-terminal domain-containing protein [Kordia sp.]|uniref:type I restriction enzyme HsdR N-terminal domain-containing protein n=1 Tax=Kordia sp. TaxID=1965332 RepID=UPI0025BF0636|nr:type I restriction enzyme HsdR N-terminal domain-containing protein [Kordia sp.]MCH2193160.1 type I restriction enzyme HsdR N-terminal domain-containing protein [Kordia sp.]